jgi:hypothetical protein
MGIAVPYQRIKWPERSSEGVFDPLDPRAGACGREFDANDVEAGLERCGMGNKIRFGGNEKFALLGGANRFGGGNHRALPPGFDFNKEQIPRVLRDNINFAAAGMIVICNAVISVARQMRGGKGFAEVAIFLAGSALSHT